MNSEHSLVPELERLHREVEGVNAAAVELCRGLSDEELAWRPSPKHWSIAENLVHLRITTEVFIPPADQAIDEARRNGWLSPGPFVPGWMDRFFVWYVEPPVRLKLPAPAPLRPLLDGPVGQVLSDFLEAQEKMAQRIHAANGLDIIKARVQSPLASFVKMSLLAFFGVYAGHGRRHIWQASNVLRQLRTRS